MKRNKMIAILLAVLCMTAVLTGCKKKNNDSEQEKDDEPVLTDEIINPEPDPEPAFGEEMEASALAQKIGGKWSDDYGTFLICYVDEKGAPRFNYGESGESHSDRDAIINHAEHDGETGYYFTVIFSGESEPLDIYADTGKPADDLITVKFPGGDYREFHYRGKVEKTAETNTETSTETGNEGSNEPPEAMTAADFSTKFRGTWKDSSKTGFVTIGVDEFNLPKITLGSDVEGTERTEGSISAVDTENDELILSVFCDSSVKTLYFKENSDGSISVKVQGGEYVTYFAS